jgi:hypothetical protein
VRGRENENDGERKRRVWRERERDEKKSNETWLKKKGEESV